MTEGILVVGKENCSRCDMVKNILTNKKIEFSYVKLEDLSQEEKSEYLKMAKEAKQFEMPIIIKDNTVIAFQEVK